MTEILYRVASPTPSFFKKLRNIGLALAAIATSIVAAPIALPAIVVKIASYLVVAGGAAAAASQSAVKGE
jgi:hypothetical protein